ncbi:MAG: YfhO family protein [Bacilli bacterium]|nr:YfhO family protein [Bacilli bacterium]
MRKKINYIIPILITSIILFILFWIQGLYPFADKSIIQVDADYQFVPVLYRIYDFLHGTGNIIYDDIGFGNNIYISMIIQGSIFSPLTLLLYFTSRENIVNYYNIIIIIKLCLLSLTTYIYINRTFKVNQFYKYSFSVLYTFSGWIILNYFNIMWLDSVILFPLIVLYLDNLLNNGKYLGYIITLSLSLIISYYISYFILIFILFYSFIYIILKLDSKKVKKTIFRLGISTITSILVSSFSLLPAIYQTFISSRVSGFYSSGIFDNFINKSLFLMFSSVFLFLFLKLIFKYNSDKKNIYIYIILFLLFGVGLFVEPINLALHMGSYWSFPYRYSFITLFILMNGSLYYLQKYNIIGYEKYQVVRFLIFILFGVFLYYFSSKFYDVIIDSQIVLDFKDVEVYKKILLIFFIIIIMTWLVFTFKNRTIRNVSFVIVCLLQIFIYSSWTMYYSDGYYLSKNSNNINNNLDIVSHNLDRYKMGYTNYTPDHAFIYDVKTLDNWLHILPDTVIDVYDRLGYQTTNTCIRSYGGTIFTDWLFNVGYLIDDKLKKDDLYELLDNYKRFYLYKYNYNNGFGLIYNKYVDFNYDNLYGFELQNKIYQDLFNSNDNLIGINYYRFDDINNKIILEYKINDKGFLYLDLFNKVNYIKVNDKYVDYVDNNYIIDLGIYEEDVIIEFATEDNSIDFSLGFIKYNDIVNLNNSNSNVEKNSDGYNIEVNNEFENGYMFLPINNISGLKLYVNDKNVEIENYLNNFVSVKLDKGYNEIKVKYEMPLFKLGLVFSLIGILFLVLINKLSINKLLLNITYYVYIILVIFMYLYYYLFPLFRYYKK